MFEKLILFSVAVMVQSIIMFSRTGITPITLWF